MNAPVHSSFDANGIQIAWDSTSLSWLKKCPQLWKYQMVDGWRSKSGPGTIDLDFGKWYHSALEHYYLLKHNGALHVEALRTVVREALESSWVRNPDGTGSPWTHDDSNKTRESLIRSIVWYLEEFGINDPAKTVVLANDKPAVELSFRVPVDHGYILAGHIDRVVEYSGDKYAMDHKTTTKTLGPYYFKGYSPHNQMTFYSIATQIAYSTPVKGVIIDAAQIGVGFTRFERGFASRQAAVLTEWLDEFYYWADLAKKFVVDNVFPKADDFCVYCHFKDICNADPRMREARLASHFERRVWNPLEPR